MDWLNYHHLFYFWTVAREGTIAAACKKLYLSPPTISAQIRELEKALGEALFTRSGRSLALTEAGRMAQRYADEIFSLGREFTAAMKGRSAPASLRFRVGIDDVLPKHIAYRLLEPVFWSPQPFRVVCIEGTPEQLLPQLAVHDLDIVLTDAVTDPNIRVRVFHHPLGDCDLKFFAAPQLAGRLRRGFPGSLHQAPALLPVRGSPIRKAIDEWFDSCAVQPKVVAEFEDTALLNVCGQEGLGFFAGHDVIAGEITRKYRVRQFGDASGLRQSFYAISVERRLRHPAAATLIETARSSFFSARKRRTARGGARPRRATV